MTFNAFQMLFSNIRIIIDIYDPILMPLAQNMVDKFMKHYLVLCRKMAILAKIHDPRFGSNILADTDILRHRYFAPLCCATIGQRRNQISSSFPQFGSKFCLRYQLYVESPSRWLISRPIWWRGNFISTCDRHWLQASGPIWMVVCKRQVFPQYRSDCPRCSGNSCVFDVQRGVFFYCWISPWCKPNEAFRRAFSIAYARPGM